MSDTEVNWRDRAIKAEERLAEMESRLHYLSTSARVQLWQIPKEHQNEYIEEQVRWMARSIGEEIFSSRRGLLTRTENDNYSETQFTLTVRVMEPNA